MNYAAIPDVVNRVTRLYDDIISGKADVQEIPLVIETKEVQFLLTFIMSESDAARPLVDSYIMFLQTCIKLLQYAYNNGITDTGISDVDYDRLYEIMINAGLEEIISAPIIKRREDVRHHSYTDLRGTLAKIYFLSEKQKEVSNIPSRKSLDDWIKSTERLYKEKTGVDIDMKDIDVIVTPKWDGVSVVLEYDENDNLVNALLRGDTTVNETRDVSYLFRDYKHHTYGDCGTSIGKPHALKIELMVTSGALVDWNCRHEIQYKKPLSLVSAITNMDPSEITNEHIDMLVVKPLREQILGSDRIADFSRYIKESMPHIICRLSDIDLIEEFAQSHRFVDFLNCDGVVISVFDDEIASVLGRTNDKNNYEVAYKFTEEVSYARVVGVTFQTGSYGRVIPVLNIEPAVMKGKVIRNISLGSIDRFNSMDLHVGDEVKVLYDVIPYAFIDSNCRRGNGKKIAIPETCEYCGRALEYNETGNILSCVNPHCICREIGTIVSFINKMRIPYIGEETVRVLYEKGVVTSIKDLYRINRRKQEVLAIPGLADVSYQNIINGINSRRDVRASELLGSIGIEGIGERKFSFILKRKTLSELLDMVSNNDVEGLSVIPGIAKKSAIKIIDGVTENKKLINFLLKELNIIDELADNSNFKVCFTKISDNLKDRYRDLIASYGGEIIDRISDDLAFLVIPQSNTVSGKTKTAVSKGKPLVLLSDLEKILMTNYKKNE